MNRPKLETAISARDAGFRFVRSSAVAVVSVAARRDSPTTSLQLVLEPCTARFAELLEGWLGVLHDHRIVLFVATPPRDPPNAVARRRGAWRDAPDWLAETTSRSPSVEIVDDDRVRFAALAEIGQQNLLAAAELVRTSSTSFLFVSSNRDRTEPRVRSLVATVFPDGAPHLDWGCVTSLVENSRDICIRVSGNFDDREASIDAFLAADLLRTLGAR